MSAVSQMLSLPKFLKNGTDRSSTTDNNPAPAHATSFGDLHPNRKKITMVGVILALLLSALDQTIVGTALPRIVSDLGGANHLTWVVTAYMLASTITVPIYGKLSDLYGRKWFFFGGIAIFLVASILCGLSGTMTQLIAFRALQGIGGGAIMGNAFAIIGDLFEPKERARWQGVLGGVFGLSSVIGPALGGWLTDNASWHYVFYVNIPLGLVALGFIGFLMPTVVSTIKDKVIDYLGAGLLITTLAPLLLALSWGGREYAWGSATILGLIALGVASLVGFLFAEHRAAQPIIPLDLFKNPVFAVSAVITLLTSAAMFGAIVYIPIFGQLVQGVSATSSGSILTPLMIGLIGGSAVSGQIVARTGRYKAVALTGGTVLAIGLFWLNTLSTATTQFELVLRMVVMGLGLGINMPVFTIAVQNAFTRDRLGVVTASTQLFRNIGGTAGTAVLGALFNNALTAKTAGLATSSYAQIAAQQHVNVTDPNVIQRLLLPESQTVVRAGLAAMPAEASVVASNAFDAFISSARTAFAGSVDHVFFIAGCLAVIALFVTFFLKELPMKASRTAPESETSEVTRDMQGGGQAIAASMGQANPKDEPVVPVTAPNRRRVANDILPPRRLQK